MKYKTKEEICEILDSILDKISFYNENIANEMCFLANAIILPNDLYFYFTSKNFLELQFTGYYGNFPVTFKDGILTIFSVKCYRTSKSDKISVEFK